DVSDSSIERISNDEIDEDDIVSSIGGRSEGKEEGDDSISIINEDSKMELSEDSGISEFEGAEKSYDSFDMF
ncbi:hypothetical protein KI387_009367, partial [Taxus chinensis]